MIYGIGLDLIEIERIEKFIISKSKSLLNVFYLKKSKLNLMVFTTKRKIEYLAGRFATKEAFSKALGTGLGKTIAFHDINCYNDHLGKPCIDYSGFRVHVSITHTENYAMSQVLLEKQDNNDDV